MNYVELETGMNEIVQSVAERLMEKEPTWFEVRQETPKVIFDRLWVEARNTSEFQLLVDAVKENHDEMFEGYKQGLIESGFTWGQVVSGLALTGMTVDNIKDLYRECGMEYMVSWLEWSETYLSTKH